jgi:hypothetical protein
VDIRATFDKDCRKGMAQLMDGKDGIPAVSQSVFAGDAAQQPDCPCFARKYPAFITQMLTLFCQQNERPYHIPVHGAVCRSWSGERDNLTAPVHILKTKVTGFPRRSPVQQGT